MVADASDGFEQSSQSPLAHTRTPTWSGDSSTLPYFEMAVPVSLSGLFSPYID